MTSAARDRDAGVTLIEMLVSLAIFAFVGLASFTMLDALLRVQDRTDGRLEDLARIDRALAVFTRDAAQSDPDGLEVSDDTITFVMPAGRQHRYAQTENGLVRTVDATADNPLTQMLLTPVTAVEFAALDTAGAWLNTWPPTDLDASVRAARLTITLDTGATVTRLVPLAESATP